jgi:hypothetical protein
MIIFINFAILFFLKNKIKKNLLILKKTVMKTITKCKLLVILLAIPLIGFAQSKDKKQRVIDANPSLYYPFESVATAANPLVGNFSIDFYTHDPNNNATPGNQGGIPLEAEGPYEGKGAVLIPKNLDLQITNPGPKTSDGGNRLNTWSLLYDIKIPTTHGFIAIFQGNETNADDEDICIRAANTIGLSDPGYSDLALTPNTWYRFVATLTVDENGVGTEKFYLDGEEILSKTGSSRLALDERFSIGDVFWIFTDENGEDDDITCAGFAFWGGKALTAAEIKTLGGYVYEGSPFAERPTLSLTEPTTIQAENFDKGGSEIAYQTGTAATNAYREEAVKIEAGPGEGNYHLVAGDGDWFNYSVFVPESKKGYDFVFYLYGQKTTGNYFSVLVNGNPVADATDVDFPTSYNDPTEAPTPLTLQQGNNIITIRSKGGNIDKLELELWSPLPPLNPNKQQRILDANPALYYPFESVTTAADPLVGDLPLQFFTAEYSATNGTPGNPGGEPQETDGPYAGKGAVLIPRNLHVQVTNPGPLASDGGNRLNTFTLLFDINYPAPTESFIAIFQGSENNSNDEDVAIKKSDNTIGIGTPGYASNRPLSPNTWYRLVMTLSFNTETQEATWKLFLDGAEILSKTGGSRLGLDQGDRFPIADVFYIFTDEDGEEDNIKTAGFAFWPGRALTSEEIYALGGVGYEGAPFKTHTIPGFVQAEDYDTGGEGVAFHAGNPVESNTYRPTETANIAAGPDGGYHLVTSDGDWYNYTISVPESKFGYDYIFKFYGQKTSASSFNVLINGTLTENTTDVEFPASYDAPVELTVPVELRRGSNLITIQSKGGNLDKIEILQAPFRYKGTPYAGEPIAIPGTFEAEHFDLGGEGVAYHDTDASNSGPSKDVRPDAPGVDIEGNTFEGEPIFNIGWTDVAEWLNYTINVSENGEYTITGVVATGGADQTFYVDIDFERVTSVPVHTENHQTFEKFTSGGFSLTAGTHILTYSSSGGINIDKFIISKANSINNIPTLSGKVYAENGILKVKGFRASASLAVYNLLGQKITAYKSLNGNVEISLPTKGIYVVKIQDEGITSNYKVIVK